MQRYLAVSLLLFVMIFSYSPVVCAEDIKKQDEWRFTLTPYFWAPSISGTMKFSLPVGSGEGKADVGPNDYLENLQFAGMMSFDAAKGRWSILSDIIYIDFSGFEGRNRSGVRYRQWVCGKRRYGVTGSHL